MRIGFLIQSLVSGGAERATVSLANEMNKRGQQVKIFTFDGDKSFYPIDDGVEIVNLNFQKLPSNPVQKAVAVIKRIFTVRKSVKRCGLDALICMNSILSGYGVVCTAFTKTKSIGTERSNPYKYFNSTVLSLVKKVSAVFCNGYIFQTAEAEKYYPSIIYSKAEVIPNAVFNPDVYSIKPLQCRQKIIYSMGRLVPLKRFDCLIDAFNIVSQKHTDYKLIIFGDGEIKQELQNQIDSLNLSDKALLPGAHKDALKFVAKGNGFVLCSEYEGMPNALMEAMAVGVPCIATRCKIGPEELIENGENGILVSDGCSKEELAQAIKQIIENEELVNKISQNAREIVETNNVERICDMWLDYLSKVV